MADVTIRATARAAAAIFIGGSTDSTTGTIESRSCIGELYSYRVGGLGVHFDFVPVEYTFSCPLPAEAGCEFGNYNLGPPEINWVRVTYVTFLFVTRITYTWLLKSNPGVPPCTGSESEWEWFTLGLSWLTIFWRVQNVRPR